MRPDYGAGSNSDPRADIGSRAGAGLSSGADPGRGRGTRFATAVERATRTNSFAIVVLVILVVALVGVAINAAIFPKESSDSNGGSSTYNWDYLKKDDGRLYYTIEGKAQSRTGIDVSEHQGYINWNAVKNDGISFAFIRVGNRGLTSGNLSQDDYFEYNVKAADQAGIEVGAYFYSQATTEEEAGYTPMIYGSLKDLLRYNLPDLARYNIWLAQYNVNSPTFNQYFSIWQYTNTGSVAGVDGNVDMNIQFLGDEKN